MIYLAAILIYWDLSMKVRDSIRRSWARSYVDRNVARWSHQLFAAARLATGFRTNYSSAVGHDLPRPAIVVCNHQSLIDIVAVRDALADLPVRFVAKQELRRAVPGVSQALRLQRHALVPRTGRVEAGIEELRRLARLARSQRICPVVFAEGTRSRNGEVLRFRTGALRIMLSETPMPIIVCAVHGGYRLRNMRAVARNFRGNTYRVRVLATFPAPATRSELNSCVDSAERLVRDQVQHWRQEESNA